MLPFVGGTYAENPYIQGAASAVLQAAPDVTMIMGVKPGQKVSKAKEAAVSEKLKAVEEATKAEPTPAPPPLEVGPTPMPAPEPVPRPPLPPEALTSPMERMAQQLAPEETVAPRPTPMENMAEVLGNDQARQAQAAIEHRQALMQDEMNRAASLEQGRRLREQQEAAPLAAEAPKPPMPEEPALSFPELSLAPEGEPLNPVKFTETAQDKTGAPIEVSRNVEANGINYKVKGENGELLAQVSFEQNPDGSLAAGHVQSFAPGRGLAEALYKQARDDGFTIRPGRAQTELGEGFVKRLQEKGLIEPGDITPTSQLVENIATYEPGVKAPSGLYKKQGGYIKLPFGKSDNVKRVTDKLPFKDQIAYLGIDRRTPDEVIAAASKGKDIDQNVAQRAFNNFTKGSIYLSERLGNNPVYKYVTDQFRNADNVAKANVQKYVHDMYVPAMKNLTDRELTDVWGALKLMEERGKRLTSDQLQSMGFNAKEQHAIAIHQEVMDSMIPKINEALGAANMPELHPQAAYVASKLTGQFRKTMMDAEGKVIGALGDRTRNGLENQVRKFKELYPDSKEGPELTFNGRNSNNLSSILDYIADKDPAMAEFLKNSEDMMSPSYRGAKTHTMAKKGVVGMEGNKPWESAYTNAYEGFESQIKYLTRMLEFAEKAKAESNSRAVLNSGDVNMPKAKELAQAYMDDALGRSRSKVNQGVDSITNAINESFGGYGSYAGDVGRSTKKYINTFLLSLRPGFLAANILQPIRNMPEMGSYLGAKGATETAATASMMKVTSMLGLTEAGVAKWSPLMEKALQYAEDNHVYSSDLIDTTGNIRKAGRGETMAQKAGSVLDAMEASLQRPAAAVEHVTRKTFFLTMVDLLDKNGVKPSEGLFDIAANLTDRGMNRYTREEAPQWVKALGPVGSAPYNLMSFKFNELSRLASLAREFSPKDLGSAKPFLTSLTMQIAMGGIMGMIGYTEADWLVRKFSEMYGKPTSLTKILLDNGDNVKAAAFGGLSSLTGVDMSGRMGVGAILGSPDVADMVVPGASAVVQGASSAYELAKGLIKNPGGSANTYNAKNAIIDIIPGGSNFERQLFPETEQGVGFNRRKAQAGFQRNTTDKVAKQFGFTGTNESAQRQLEYENDLQDKWYKDKQKDAILDMAKSFKTSGKVDNVYIQNYIKAGGDPTNLEQTLPNIAMEQNIPQDVQAKLKLAVSNSYSSVQRMKRRFH